MSVPMPTANSTRAVAGNLSDAERACLREFCRREIDRGVRSAAAAHRTHQRSGESPQVSYQTFLSYFRDELEGADIARVAGNGASDGGAAVTPLPIAGGAPSAPRRVRRAASSAPASFGFSREGVEFAAEWDGAEWQVTIRAGMPNDMMLRYAGLLQRDFFDL